MKEDETEEASGTWEGAVHYLKMFGGVTRKKKKRPLGISRRRNSGNIEMYLKYIR
jgi:hypothetical protein